MPSSICAWAIHGHGLTHPTAFPYVFNISFCWCIFSHAIPEKAVTFFCFIDRLGSSTASGKFIWRGRSKTLFWTVKKIQMKFRLQLLPFPCLRSPPPDPFSSHSSFVDGHTAHCHFSITLLASFFKKMTPFLVFSQIHASDIPAQSVLKFEWNASSRATVPSSSLSANFYRQRTRFLIYRLWQLVDRRKPRLMLAFRAGREGGKVWWMRVWQLPTF